MSRTLLHERARGAARDLRWLGAVALLCVSWLYFQGARGLYDPDEGRYADVALEMLRTGDWFTPRLNDDLEHFTKPPLTYWILASSMAVLGESERAMRIPIALAFVITVLLTRGIARRLVPADPDLPAVVQATSLFPVVAASLITTDPLLILWETLGVFGFVETWWGRPSPRWSLMAMWTGFGLAFLTKGPPGLLPLASIVVFAAWSRGGAGIRRLARPAHLIVFSLIAFGWIGLQLVARPDLLRYYLGVEVVGRLSGAHLRNRGWGGIVDAYVPVILLGLLPWPVAALRGRRDRATPQAPPGALRFLLLWVLIPLAVFCAAQSRLPLYLLPLTVPGALLIGHRLSGWRPAGWRWGLALWIACLVTLEATAAFYPEHRDGRRFAAQLASLLDEKPSEVVFVDRPPRWSVGVYMNCGVERVEAVAGLASREAPSYEPTAESLRYELGEHEEGGVYLVPPTSLDLWRPGMESRGWTLRHLGEIDDLEVFVARPPAGSEDSLSPR